MSRQIAALVVVLLAACSGGGGSQGGTSPPPPPTVAGPPGNAFFYQDVGLGGINSVRVGFTTDGRVVQTYGVNLMSWQALRGQAMIYGDAVFSRLANGRWVMTAGTGVDDPRGPAGIMYHEASCPQVVDAAVKVWNPARTASCDSSVPTSTAAKVSQVFELDGARLLFTATNGRVYIAKISDATHAAADLQSICFRRTPVARIADLAWGEATAVIDATITGNLFVSDTAIARRRDGTWVLFLKGIALPAGCQSGQLCELCARSIYRTTSTNLMTWTALEKVVEQASVPDAGVDPDGNVRLYWQNFVPACAAQNLQLAARAPITGAAEQANFALGTPANTTYPGEAFETNTQLHFPTNGNPVLLPDAAAKTALDACFGR
jgi:hypothetical protein